jgi:2-polyprenyl-3-methyl-5-hydroxy-6-metoxy-1,4-benzoquinol methylase
MTALPDLGLSVRHRTPEIMDDPGLDRQAHESALCGLERINRLSRTDRALWLEIASLERPSGAEGRPLRLLDVACGGGFVGPALAARAHRAGHTIHVEGCDVSPRAVDFASRRAREARLVARFFTCDALAGPLPDRYDIITCSLFLHHLGEKDAVVLLERMARAATRLVLVDDLVRSTAGYLLACVGGRILSRSSVVHADGPASVRAAFSIDEVRALATRAGLERATIRRHWPERFLLSWRRP